MTLVDTETGEVVELLTLAAAEEITYKIKGHVSQAWLLLCQAHTGRADIALGYDSWEAYVRAEFDIGRQYAYRLINMGAVLKELEVRVSPMGDIPLPTTERQTRPLAALKDEPEAMVEAWTAAVEEADGGSPTAAQVADAVAAKQEDAGGSNPAPKGGAAPAATDPPADPEEQERRALKAELKACRKIEADVRAMLLTYSPGRRLAADSSRDGRREVATFAVDLYRVRNACDRALAALPVASKEGTE